MEHWCSGSTSAFQADNAGSNPVCSSTGDVTHPPAVMGFPFNPPYSKLTAGKDRPPGFEPWPGGSYGETGSGWGFYSSSFPSGPVQFRHSPPLKRGDLTMTFDIRASRGATPARIARTGILPAPGTARNRSIWLTVRNRQRSKLPGMPIKPRPGSVLKWTAADIASTRSTDNP